MKFFLERDQAAIVDWLMAGKVAVVRTDTLYGLVCRADNQAAVERVYRVKGRDGDKSPIVLIATSQQLFDTPSDETQLLLDTVWPGKTSVVIATNQAPHWIERGNGSVAYRLPEHTWLQSLLSQTGPLVAPSANPQGQPPARNVEQAIAYFGDDVDFYVDGGEVTDDTPSRLLRMAADGRIERLR